MAKRNTSSQGEPATIKKYANRRLYNTATSSYVTLDHLSEMVKQGQDFVVQDAKTGEDITRSVLTQIIFEEEGKGQNLLPVNFLRQLIGFYGDNLQSFVPTYLEMTMEAFANEQAKMRDRVAATFSGRSQMEQFEEQMRQNMAMFDKALKMFSPFGPMAGAPEKTGSASHQPTGSQTEKEIQEAPPGPKRDEEIDELKQQVAEMQSLLRQITDKGNSGESSSD